MQLLVTKSPPPHFPPNLFLLHSLEEQHHHTQVSQTTSFWNHLEYSAFLKPRISSLDKIKMIS